MTRLSDALRGAADRAPVEHVSVSAADASRRVRRVRGLRGAANGLVGAGAIAVAALAFVSPTLPLGNPGTESGAPSVPEDRLSEPRPMGGGEVAQTDSAMYATYGYLPYCGETPAALPETDGTLTLSASRADDAVVEGGGIIPATLVVTTAADTTYSTMGVDAWVLWEGQVVAVVPAASKVSSVFQANAGDVQEAVVEFSAVNCFDGAALPAGNYELVLSQEFTPVSIVGEPEPTPAVTVAPVEPKPTEPSAIPDTEPATDPAETTVAPADPAVDPATSEMIAPDYVVLNRLAATPLPFTVAGEPVEDPFGDFLGTPYVQQPLPEGTLTPEEARTLYAAGLTNEPWNMAPGTSRWIMPSGSGTVDKMMYNDQGPYFGCSWDGTTGRTFPTESSTFDLLSVSGSVPANVTVNYGWIVEGNPGVTLTASNPSDKTLLNFWGPNAMVYLVDASGVVVAESYLVEKDPFGPGSISAQNNVAPDSYYQPMSPGDSITGDFLWRDLSGCWNGERSQVVPAGTYTVLTMNYVSVSNDNGGGVIYPAGMAEEDLATAPSTAVEPGTLVAPDATMPVYDYVDLQLWTSIGTVTVTQN